jgi:hypothetical protein
MSIFFKVKKDKEEVPRAIIFKVDSSFSRFVAYNFYKFKSSVVVLTKSIVNFCLILQLRNRHLTTDHQMFNL